MKRRYMSGIVLIVLLLLVFSAAQAGPQRLILDHQGLRTALLPAGSGFLSYQGSLVHAADSTAVTDTLEMTFGIYDSETKGKQLWHETIEVQVRGGLFSVRLGEATPFPEDLFNGQSCFLQVQIEAQILEVRQEIGWAAHSHWSRTADELLGLDLNDLDDRWVKQEDLDHLDAADGDPAAALHVDDEGRVGIGTATPEHKLTVSGDSARIAIIGTDKSPEMILKSALDSDDQAWKISKNLSSQRLIMQNGASAQVVVEGPVPYVGIGKEDPEYTLDVDGEVRATAFRGDGSNLTGISGTTDSDWQVTNGDMHSLPYGNVGVGTDTPAGKLHVVGPDGNYSIIGGPGYGVYGRYVSGDNYGYLGGPDHAVFGYAYNFKEEDQLPTSVSAVYGQAEGGAASGVYGIDTGSGNFGVLGHPDYAGYFSGDVEITGDLAIGIAPSAYPLNVHGMANMLEFSMPTGAAAGHVLTSDASGVGTWQLPPSGLWTDQGNYIQASTSQPFDVYDNDPVWWGLCYIGDSQTGASTHYMNDGAEVSHCYSHWSAPDLFGTWATAFSDSNDIAVYGYGEEWGGYFSCTGGGVAVMGEGSDSTRYGLLGAPSYGVLGQHESGHAGYLGGSLFGAYGYSGHSSPNTAGAYGYHASGADGTGYYYSQTHCGTLGRMLWGADYHCGVQGTNYSNDAGVRVSGVQGIFSNDTGIWGSLAYKTSGSNEYGGYFTSYTGGGGGKSYQDDDASTSVGLGAWGDLFGADIHGKLYGTFTEGEHYGLYSHGLIVRDDLDLHLQDEDTGETTVLYTNVSTDVTVQTSGYCRLSQGRCAVTFDENFRRVVSSETPVVVTVTPIGSSSGVHLDRVDPGGFIVVENNAGKSDAQVAFIAIGRRAGYEHPDLPPEVVSADYVDKLSRGLHNDAGTAAAGQGLYYADGRLSVGRHASMLPRPDKSKETGEMSEPQLPATPRRTERGNTGQDNRVR